MVDRDLAGLEIDFERLRGRVLRLTSAAFVVSFTLASVVGLVMGAYGIVGSPLLIALVAAGLLSVVVFPLLAIPRLGRRDPG